MSKVAKAIYNYSTPPPIGAIDTSETLQQKDIHLPRIILCDQRASCDIKKVGADPGKLKVINLRDGLKLGGDAIKSENFSGFCQCRVNVGCR